MKIVVLDGHLANPGDLDWSPLTALGNLTVWDRTAPRQIIERAANAEILLTNKVAIGRDHMDMLTRLRCIVVMATGYANIDVAYAKLLGIPVFTVPGYSTNSVVQHCIGFLLMASNSLAELSADVRAGSWQQAEDFSYHSHPLSDLEGKTLGILGFGEIGSRVAGIARSFGMKVLVGSSRAGALEGWEAVPYRELAGRCDYLSLHTNLNDATQNIIDADFLSAHAKRPLVLINTARGGLVDSAAALQALERGWLLRYLSDVMPQEPPAAAADLALIQHPRVSITPHVAWSSLEARSRLLTGIVGRVRAFLDGDLGASLSS